MSYIIKYIIKYWLSFTPYSYHELSNYQNKTLRNYWNIHCNATLVTRKQNRTGYISDNFEARYLLPTTG